MDKRTTNLDAGMCSPGLSAYFCVFPALDTPSVEQVPRISSYAEIDDQRNNDCNPWSSITSTESVVLSSN